jgi:CRP-like cAMP-binding protein
VITIEKVAVLRGIPMFVGIPDFVLAAVAQVTEEVELEPGATVIQEHAIEDCLYLIVEGEVRVHSQDRTIIALGAGQAVGELAVLDPEPRSASATTLTYTRLLRLAKEPFDEVMADRPEIAQGVIRALCERIREQGRLMVTRTDSVAGKAGAA